VHCMGGTIQSECTIPCGLGHPGNCLCSAHPLLISTSGLGHRKKWCAVNALLLLIYPSISIGTMGSVDTFGACLFNYCADGGGTPLCIKAKRVTSNAENCWLAVQISQVQGLRANRWVQINTLCTPGVFGKTYIGKGGVECTTIPSPTWGKHNQNSPKCCLLPFWSLMAVGQCNSSTTLVPNKIWNDAMKCPTMP